MRGLKHKRLAIERAWSSLQDQQFSHKFGLDQAVRSNSKSLKPSKHLQIASVILFSHNYRLCSIKLAEAPI